MTVAERAFVARLQRRAHGLSPELARRELQAYQAIRNVLSERELVRAIESGQLDRLIFEVLSDDVLDPTLLRLRAGIEQGVVDAARGEALRGLPSFLKPQAFGVLNPLVVDAARALDIKATGALKAEVRETVRQYAIEGLEAGLNPRTVARRIPSVIGLAPSQEAAVRNFRDELLRGDRGALRRALARGRLTTASGEVIVRKAHAGGRGLGARDMAFLREQLGSRDLTPEQVERMVDAYRKRLMAWNTESHARTIALDAQKAGQRAAWEDAIRRGVVGRDQLVRTWVAVGGPVGDGRNRPEHLALHGTKVGFDEPFPNGQLTPGESDFNCRCQARVTIRYETARAAA